MVTKRANNYTGRDFATISNIVDVKWSPPSSRLYAARELRKMKSKEWETILLILSFLGVKGRVNRLLCAGEDWLSEENQKYGKQEKGVSERRKRSPRIALDTDLRKYKSLTKIMLRLFQIIEPAYEKKAANKKFWEDERTESGRVVRSRRVVREWISKLITAILNSYFYPLFINTPFTPEQVRKRIKIGN